MKALQSCNIGANDKKCGLCIHISADIQFIFVLLKVLQFLLILFVKRLNSDPKYFQGELKVARSLSSISFLNFFLSRN